MSQRAETSSGRKSRSKENQINDAQAKTVDEHFELLMTDNRIVGTDHTDVDHDDLPEWYDKRLFQAGQNYYRKNLLTMGLTSLIGLLAVIVIPSILKVLVFTRQSGTVCTAYKRYLETLLHIYTLYTSDIENRRSNWWKSLNTIRWKHAMSSRRSTKTQSGAITQRDMALTQFGFVGYALIRPRELALTHDPKGVEGLVHFWRVVGHILGIPDEMNICRKNAAETTQLCKRLLDDIYVKHMIDPPPKFEHMSSVLIDGMWSIDPSLDTGAFMYLWYKLSGLEYPKPLSIYSWLNVQYRNIVLAIIRTPIIGTFVRCGFNVYITIIYYIAQHYPVLAWWRHGRAASKIKLYPRDA